MASKRAVKWGGEYCMDIALPTGQTIYACPAGFAPGTGQVILPREKAIAAIDAGPANLEFTDDKQTLTFVNLIPTEIRRIDKQNDPYDKNAPMILSFTDARILGSMSDTSTVLANTRPQASGDDYMTLPDAVSPTSWQTLVDNLWAGLPAEFGDSPTLPYEPHGVPDGFRFDGVSAYMALQSVCMRLSTTLIYNPFTGEFSLVRIGDVQDDPDNLPSYPEFDSQLQTNKSITTPEKIAVYFHDYWKNYGTELDFPADVTAPAESYNWLVKPPYARLEKATGADEGEFTAGTTIALWNDLKRVYDESDADSNADDRNTRAQEIIDNYLLDAATPERDMVWGQLVQSTPGSWVKAIVWSMTPLPQTRAVTGSGFGRTIGSDYSIHRESFAPPDIARSSFPNYPRLQQVVRVYVSSESEGDMIEPVGQSDNSNDIFTGYTCLFRQGTYYDVEECYIQLIDDEDTGNTTYARDGEYLIGRLSGTATYSGSVKPLYLARRGERSAIIRFELYENLTLDGTSAEAYILDGTGADVGDTITVHDTVGQWAGLGRDGETAGCQGWAVWMPDAGRYEIIFLEGVSRWVEFTLTEDMGYTTSSEASASVQYYWGSAPNGKDPNTPITVTDTQDHFGDKEDGDKGIAVWDESREIYVITKMESSEKVFWGKVYTAPTGTPPTGEVYPCDDASGSNPAATAIDVIFPEIAGATCVIVADDVISYAVATDGTFVCVSDYSVGGAAQWVMATQQWTDGDTPYVICQAVTDPDSAPEEGADDLTVYLPRTCPLDPNVSMGAILAIAPDGNGDYVCVSDYLDGVIGEVKMVGNITTPEGWADCDGSANAGGSGMDMRGLFPRAWGANERTETEITKTDGYTIGDYSGDGTTGGDDAGSIDDHDEHYHTQTPMSADTGGAGDTVAEGNVLTSGVRNAGGSAATLSHSAFDNRPAFGVLKFIERMDNSMSSYPDSTPGAGPNNDPTYDAVIDIVTGDVEIING